MDFVVGFRVGLNDGTYDNSIVGSITGFIIGLEVESFDGPTDGTIEEILGTRLTSVGAILPTFKVVVEGIEDGGFEIDGVLVFANVGREVEIVEGFILDKVVAVGKYVDDTLGTADNTAVGMSLGPSLGKLEGRCDGLKDGELLELLVGMRIRENDGRFDGELLGSVDGTVLESVDGIVVGT